MLNFILHVLASSVPLAHANNDWLQQYCETLHPGCGAGSQLLIQIAGRVADVVLDIIGGVAVIMFLWGALMITISGGSEERKNQGQQIIIAALIGIFLAVVGNAVLAFVGDFVGQYAG